MALAGVAAYVIRLAVRSHAESRGIDVGAVSTGWIAEHRREEPR